MASPSHMASWWEDLNRIRVIFLETLYTPSFISSSRNSAVGVVTGLQMDAWGIVVLFASGQHISPEHPDWLSVPSSLSFTRYRGSFSGGDAANAWSGHFTPSLAEVKNEWSYTCTSTSSVCLYGVYRSSFTCSLSTSFSFFRTRSCVLFLIIFTTTTTTTTTAAAARTTQQQEQQQQ